MAHDLTGAHAALIATGQYDDEVVLDITLNDGATHLYLSSGDVEIDGIVYQNTLSSSVTLKQSLTRSIDRVALEISNVDMLLGRAVSGVEEFNNLRGRLGVVHIDPVTRIAYYNEEMEGDIISPEVDETADPPVVRVALVDDFDTTIIYGQTVAEAFPYSDPPPASQISDPNDLVGGGAGGGGSVGDAQPPTYGGGGGRGGGGRYESIESMLAF